MRRLKTKAILASVVFAMLFLQCGIVGPCVSPSIEGRVLDSTDERPLAGVEVFVTYDYHSCGLVFGGSSKPIATQWATTDEEGGFSVSARLLLKVPACGWIDRRPDFFVYHREVGLQLAERKPAKESAPPTLLLSVDSSRINWSSCSPLTRSGCRHYCDLTNRSPCPK
jgi:hypothetical protein